MDALPRGRLACLSAGTADVDGIPDPDTDKRRLRARGWRPEGAQYGSPDGDRYRSCGANGNDLARLGEARPGVLERNRLVMPTASPQA